MPFYLKMVPISSRCSFLKETTRKDIFRSYPQWRATNNYRQDIQTRNYHSGTNCIPTKIIKTNLGFQLNLSNGEILQIDSLVCPLPCLRRRLPQGYIYLASPTSFPKLRQLVESVGSCG